MVGDILIKSGELYLEADSTIEIWRKSKKQREKEEKEEGEVEK